MIKTITLAILMIALSGCNSIKESRIRSDILSDPNIKPEIKYLIEKREVRYGMTKEQVQAAWGLPCRRCYFTRKHSHGEIWEYNPFGSSPLGKDAGTYLHFGRDGKLVLKTEGKFANLYR